MTILKIYNPFNAPVYHEKTVESTMAFSRRLAQRGCPHGTVITADFQKAGRGRIPGRTWQTERGLNLMFTILLRFPSIEEIPAALTLRIGLTLLAAIEDFTPSLKDRVMVKWPNDIIIDNKKIAGILCEAECGNVHAGVGINFAQKDFPLSLSKKASSIALVCGREIDPRRRFCLLEKILERLCIELVNKKTDEWKSRLEDRLYKKNEKVIFTEGAAGSGREVHGRLKGITEGGELLIIPDGETQARPFVTGELMF